ncbi:MAG: PIN domain-containing protein [Chloroflexi bacterium]|nr:PIN domain-containing protein [Chloroflexota bacterium]
MLLVDAGILFIQADRDDPAHDQVVRLIQHEPGPLLTSQIVLAEADYLVMSRLGIEVELSFLEDLSAGTFIADCMSRDEFELTRQLAERYRDLQLGLADASLVVLAQRYGTRRLATLNERDFRAVVPLQGGTFTLLPADLQATSDTLAGNASRADET